MNRFGLTIAVPRGALFDETLDALERIGVDAGEVRANDRRLLFEDVGIVTMRPSDVPTYVEAGAADLGITGKDVLMEQHGRQVFEQTHQPGRSLEKDDAPLLRGRTGEETRPKSGSRPVG